MPARSALALPPVAGMVYISPNRSNTMGLPSGLTSKLIQVPSSVVKTCSLSFQLSSWLDTSHLSDLSCALTVTKLKKANNGSSIYLHIFQLIIIYNSIVGD